MNLFGLYRQVGARKASLIGAIAAITGAVLAWMLPIAIAKARGGSEVSQERVLASRDIAYGKSPACFPAAFSQNLSATLKIPNEMRLNETKLVLFSIGLARDYRLVCELDGVTKDQRVLKAQAALQSPGLDISPSAEPITLSDADQVQWSWLIRPKSPGEHAIRMVSEGQAGLTVDLQKLLPRADGIDESPHQVVATIQVFTELGLTSRQDAALKAIGAVLGIFGVVLGYPIFAMNRRQSSSETVDDELRDGWPTAKTRKALSQKVTTLSLDQWRLILAVELMEGQGVHRVVEACHGAVGPSEAYHRLRSLEADDLVALNKGTVHLSGAVKRVLGRAKLADLRPLASS